jgi:hypothetical protein
MANISGRLYLFTREGERGLIAWISISDLIASALSPTLPTDVEQVSSLLPWTYGDDIIAPVPITMRATSALSCVYKHRYWWICTLNQSTAQWYSYDTIDNKWDEKAPLPMGAERVSVHHTNRRSNDNSLLFTYGSGISNTCYQYNDKHDIWEAVPEMNKNNRSSITRIISVPPISNPSSTSSIASSSTTTLTERKTLNPSAVTNDYLLIYGSDATQGRHLYHSYEHYNPVAHSRQRVIPWSIPPWTVQGAPFSLQIINDQYGDAQWLIWISKFNENDEHIAIVEYKNAMKASEWRAYPSLPLARLSFSKSYAHLIVMSAHDSPH